MATQSRLGSGLSRTPNLNLASPGQLSNEERRVRGLGPFSVYPLSPRGPREPEHGGWTEGPPATARVRHFNGHLLAFAMYCVCDSPGLLPACSGCSEHTQSCPPQHAAVLPDDPTSHPVDFVEHCSRDPCAISVWCDSIPSQDSMTAVCCGWRDQLGSLSP